jgi:hypothetical protein
MLTVRVTADTQIALCGQNAERCTMKAAVARSACCAVKGNAAGSPAPQLCYCQ